MQYSQACTHTLRFTHKHTCKISTNRYGHHTSTLLGFDPLMLLHFSRTSSPRWLQQCNTSCHFALCTVQRVLCIVSLHGSLFLSAPLPPLLLSPCRSFLVFFSVLTSLFAFNQLHHDQIFMNASCSTVRRRETLMGCRKKYLTRICTVPVNRLYNVNISKVTKLRSNILWFIKYSMFMTNV